MAHARELVDVTRAPSDTESAAALQQQQQQQQQQQEDPYHFSSSSMSGRGSGGAGTFRGSVDGGDRPALRSGGLGPPTAVTTAAAADGDAAAHHHPFMGGGGAVGGGGRGRRGYSDDDDDDDDDYDVGIVDDDDDDDDFDDSADDDDDLVAAVQRQAAAAGYRPAVAGDDADGGVGVAAAGRRGVRASPPVSPGGTHYHSQSSSSSPSSSSRRAARQQQQQQQHLQHRQYQHQGPQPQQTPAHLQQQGSAAHESFQRLQTPSRARFGGPVGGGGGAAGPGGGVGVGGSGGGGGVGGDAGDGFGHLAGGPLVDAALGGGSAAGGGDGRRRRGGAGGGGGGAGGRRGRYVAGVDSVVGAGGDASGGSTMMGGLDSSEFSDTSDEEDAAEAILRHEVRMADRAHARQEAAEAVPLNQQLWIVGRRRNLEAWSLHVASLSGGSGGGAAGGGDGGGYGGGGLRSVDGRGSDLGGPAAPAGGAYAFTEASGQMDELRRVLDELVPSVRDWRHYDIAREYYLTGHGIGPARQRRNGRSGNHPHHSHSIASAAGDRQGADLRQRGTAAAGAAAGGSGGGARVLGPRGRGAAQLRRTLPELSTEAAQMLLTRQQLHQEQRDLDVRERQLLTSCGAEAHEVTRLIGTEALLVQSRPPLEEEEEEDILSDGGGGGGGGAGGVRGGAGGGRSNTYGTFARRLWRGEEDTRSNPRRKRSRLDYEARDRDNSALIVLLLSFFLSFVGVGISMVLYGRRRLPTAVTGCVFGSLLCGLIAFFAFLVIQDLALSG